MQMCAMRSKNTSLFALFARHAGTLLGAFAVAACSSPAGTTSDDAGTEIASGDVGPELGVGQICMPGTATSCATDDYVTRCNDGGTAIETVLCTNVDGDPTKCFDAGRCAECVPGLSKRCAPTDSTAVEKCDDAGHWVTEQQCDAASGQQCAPGGLCQKACEINVKANSYVGCAFWATDLDNAFVPGGARSYFDAANAQYAIVVSNPSDKLTSQIKISYFEDGKEQEQLIDSSGADLDLSPLGPGELRTFLLPARNIDATSLSYQAWRVTSSSPIAAYQFNPLENVGVYSNDATNLLPEELLGTYYIAMTREETFSILRSFITIVATQGGPTNVTVTFPSPDNDASGGTWPLLTLASQDGSILSYKSGESASFTLNQWGTLNLETNMVGSDLTGAVILADKKIAVFAGSEAANVPNTNHCDVSKCKPGDLATGQKCGRCVWDGKTQCASNDDCGSFIICCADHLEMQMFPVPVWDNHYVAVKLFPRGKERDSWRIMAATNGTIINLVPPPKDPKGKQVSVPVLDKGEWYEFETVDNFEINSRHDDKTPAPVLVGHFMASQDAPDPGAQPDDAGTGDPAFLLAIPSAQWRSEYVFLTPDKYRFNYVSVAAPIHRVCSATTGNKGKVCTTDSDCGADAAANSCADDTVVTFDGQPVPPDQFFNISKAYKGARFAVNAGPHTIRGLPVLGTDGKPAESRVAVDVYGFDQYVSYGYPAGLDLKDLKYVKQPGQ
jgi:hypothetical protein